MKKVLLAVAAVAAMSLVSCNSVDSKIDKINSLAKEGEELALKCQTGDQEACVKMLQIASEMGEIAKEFQGKELTEEQQAKLEKAFNGEL